MFGIYDLHTDVGGCGCTLGEKALAKTGNKTCISIVPGLPVWCSANLPSPPVSMEMSWKSLHWKLTLGGKALGEPGNKTCISIVPGLPVWCSANLPMAYQFPWKWASWTMKESALKADWKEKPMVNKGIKPASVLSLAFQSDALPS